MYTTAAIFSASLCNFPGQYVCFLTVEISCLPTYSLSTFEPYKHNKSEVKSVGHSMSSKGPLDGFYKDSLRMGNLKVRRNPLDHGTG
jgi:hypothetical protein